MRNTKSDSSVRGLSGALILMLLCGGSASAYGDGKVTLKSTAIVLATKGEEHVTIADVRAFTPQLTDRDFEELRRNPDAFQKNVEDVANAKYASKKLSRTKLSSGNKAWSEEDEIIDQVGASRGRFTAALALSEKKGRTAAQLNVKNLEIRARELYETTDATSLRTALAADIRIVLFDFSARPFSDQLQRISRVVDQIGRSPEDFSKVASEYSDDKISAANDGLIVRVPASNMSDIMAETVFKQLTPGKVSGVLSHPKGLIIIRLEKIHPPVKRPFEGAIRDAAMARAEAEAGLVTRESRRTELLSGDDLVLNNSAIREQLIIPDTSVLERWKAEQPK